LLRRRPVAAELPPIRVGSAAHRPLARPSSPLGRRSRSGVAGRPAAVAGFDGKHARSPGKGYL